MVSTEAEEAAAVDRSMQDEDYEVPSPPKKHVIHPEYNPVENLLGKLERWLLQQPEWAVILAAPRKTRRQAVSLLSKRLLTYPVRGGKFGGSEDA
jgi:hypothetical protein